MRSPLGELTLSEAGGAITALAWGGPAAEPSSPVLQQAVAELEAYFAGELRAFTVARALTGSAFTRRFLQTLIDIPYGETRTYGALAAELGVSAQAIGQACGANIIPILIPCHRVVGAGNLGGYSGAGGVEAKVELLKLEGAASLLI